MSAGTKFIGSMFAWAAFCRLSLEMLPRNPSAYVLVPFVLISVLGLVWVPAKVAWGMADANKLTSLTIYVWIGMAALALVIFLALGL